MHIFITGGTGLIGRALIPKLSEHTITVLSRSPEKHTDVLPNTVNFISHLHQIENFDEIDAVINLAGEPIIDKRWNPEQKAIISASRWNITQQLTEKIQDSKKPPKVFISGSAVGYYGDQGDTQIDESLIVESDKFTHTLCEQWEKLALAAESKKTRVCILRTGIVLSSDGGALKKMWLPYSLGLGGPIGEGKQFMPWIHIDDMVNGMLFLLDNTKAKGVFNFTSPHPVSNRTFSKTLAETLKRPHFLFTPSIALKFILGESSQLLTDSLKVIPKALEDAGFQFQFTELSSALNDIVNQKK